MNIFAHVTPSEFPLGTVIFLSGFSAGVVATFVFGRFYSWREGVTAGGDSDRGRQLPLQ